MFQYSPERIIIDQAVSAEPLTEQICERFPEVPRTVVEKFAWHQDESGTDPLRNPLTQGKKTLHLKYFKPIKVHARCLVDARFYWDFWTAKLPERIR